MEHELVIWFFLDSANFQYPWLTYCNSSVQVGFEQQSQYWRLRSPMLVSPCLSAQGSPCVIPQPMWVLTPSSPRGPVLEAEVHCPGLSLSQSIRAAPCNATSRVGADTQQPLEGTQPVLEDEVSAPGWHSLLLMRLLFTARTADSTFSFCPPMVDVAGAPWGLCYEGSDSIYEA